MNISYFYNLFAPYLSSMIYLTCTVNCAILNNFEKYINKFIVPQLWCALSLCEVYLMYMN